MQIDTTEKLTSVAELAGEPDDAAQEVSRVRKLTPWSNGGLGVGERVLDKFEVEALIGEGGLGRVYRVRHLALGKTFALKLLRGHSAKSPSSRQRFVEEARAAANLCTRSRHVAQVLDSGGLPDGTPYIVLELLGGLDLSKLLLRQRLLDVGSTVVLALQVLDALREAHAAGIVHRDVKPANLFLLGGDVNYPDVRVLDFGIARHVRDSATTGRRAGSPHYVSPEQLGDLAVDGRADLWALGVTMYECLCGRVPFDGSCPANVLQRILHAAPLPIPCRVPDGVEEVVRRALAKDPCARFPNADAMAMALLPHVPSELLGGVPPHWGRSLRAHASRRSRPTHRDSRAPTLPETPSGNARVSTLPEPPPPSSRVVRPGPEVPGLLRLPLDQRILHVLRLADGTTTRDEIVLASALPADETRIIIEELVGMGALLE